MNLYFVDYFLIVTILGVLYQKKIPLSLCRFTVGLYVAFSIGLKNYPMAFIYGSNLFSLYVLHSYFKKHDAVAILIVNFFVASICSNDHYLVGLWGASAGLLSMIYHHKNDAFKEFLFMMIPGLLLFSIGDVAHYPSIRLMGLMILMGLGPSIFWIKNVTQQSTVLFLLCFRSTFCFSLLYLIKKLNIVFPHEWLFISLLLSGIFLIKEYHIKSLIVMLDTARLSMHFLHSLDPYEHIMSLWGLFGIIGLLKYHFHALEMITDLSKFKRDAHYFVIVFIILMINFFIFPFQLKTNILHMAVIVFCIYHAIFKIYETDYGGREFCLRVPMWSLVLPLILILRHFH